MPTIIPPARDRLLTTYHKIAAQIPPSTLDAQRTQFLTQFPPESLTRLKHRPLLELMHGTESTRGMLYELEFGRTVSNFGSIAGGSAWKFQVYRSQEGAWIRRVGGNSEPCSEEEAIRISEELAASLSRGVDLATRLHLDAGQYDDWIAFHNQVNTDPYLGLGWMHKYLAIVHPQVFSFHHSDELLAGHLVRLGILPKDESRWLRDWQWRNFRQSDPELAPLHPVCLMHAAFQAFGDRVRYWRIGTTAGEGGPDRWPAMRDGSFVSIGWNHLGNLDVLLEGLSGKPATDRLRDMCAPHDTPGATLTQQASQIYAFHSRMRVGDRVVAMHGKDLKGVGIVESPYQFDESDTLQSHHRKVRWLDANPPQFDVDPPGVRKSVYDFTGKYPQAVFVERIAAPLESLPAGPVEPAVTPLTEEASRIKTILERKGQVILYGPPGTGKTYHARRTAQELIARHRYAGRGVPNLTEAERAEVDRQITFCTFHPAYAYEDFVEGYRPVVQNGHASYEIRPGIFLQACQRAQESPAELWVFIIDEINRGNVPAIMGELITLLEMDKRETLHLTLPLSHKPFTVPKNLWIIGTMNTADRSISLLDAALRRRFGFYELLPEPDRLDVLIDGLPLSTLLSELNARIRRTVPRNARELQIGHSYFMCAGKIISTREELWHVMRDDVIPLVSEYCFENYGVLHEILGDEIIDVGAQVAVRAGPAEMHNALLRLLEISGRPLQDDEEDGDR